MFKFKKLRILFNIFFAYSLFGIALFVFTSGKPFNFLNSHGFDRILDTLILSENIESINIDLNEEILEEVNAVHSNQPNPAP